MMRVMVNSEIQTAHLSQFMLGWCCVSFHGNG